MNFQEQPLCVCLGMGVDSVALLVGLHQRGIRPDLITFADTGGEKPETYDYMPVFEQWLRDVGFPVFQVCKYVPKFAPYKDLYGNCWQNETLPSQAFGMGSCSIKWKHDAQEPLRKRLPDNVQAWAEGKKVIKAIGFDATEEYRTYRGKGKSKEEYEYWYPLQDWGWDRHKCKQVIASEGLPIPVKSACWFCPASKKHEIEWLRQTHPELYEKAIALEQRYRNGKHWRGEQATTVGLGRRFAWMELPMTSST